MRIVIAFLATLLFAVSAQAQPSCRTFDQASQEVAVSARKLGHSIVHTHLTVEQTSALYKAGVDKGAFYPLAPGDPLKRIAVLVLSTSPAIALLFFYDTKGCPIAHAKIPTMAYLAILSSAFGDKAPQLIPLVPETES